jgi:hypothetical protein
MLLFYVVITDKPQPASYRSLPVDQSPAADASLPGTPGLGKCPIATAENCGEKAATAERSRPARL